jgi:hypothetical protein
MLAERRIAERKERGGTMRKITIAALAVVLTLALSQTVGAITFMGNGSGSLMTSPATYSGTFISGLTGTWSFTINDSMWPAAGDTTARFNHIWNTYFAGNYDNTVGAEGWWGFFDGNTTPSAPQLVFTTTAPTGWVGTMKADMAITILIRDWYADGILDQAEKHRRNHQLSATFSVNPTLGTGDYYNMCGNGSLSAGNFNFKNPPTLDSLTPNGQVTMYNCPSPVESQTWGAIKALYR